MKQNEWKKIFDQKDITKNELALDVRSYSNHLNNKINYYNKNGIKSTSKKTQEKIMVGLTL